MNKIQNLSLASLIIFLAGCAQSGVQTADYQIDPSDFVDQDLVAAIAESELSQSEIDGLLLMREEEKLARDIYTVLGQKWNLPIFANIAESEQTHTDAVAVLLDRYQLSDPVVSDEVGVFSSSVLGQIYDDLLAKGEKSLKDALMVGATVEDLDINDLTKLLSETDNQDIKIVYNNLMKGSRNHLRAFTKQIERAGGTYAPAYISVEAYEAIISAPQERGRL